MKLSSHCKSAKGFSLIELMVVVAIIGILAALAVPRFRTFQAKARQTEAKSNLTHIYTLEESYHGDNDSYAALSMKRKDSCMENDLGFKVEPCNKGRYDYAVSNVSTTNFTADATSGDCGDNQVNPNCKADHWQIDQDKNLTAAYDSVKVCGSCGG